MFYFIIVWFGKQSGNIYKLSELYSHKVFVRQKEKDHIGGHALTVLNAQPRHC